MKFSYEVLMESDQAVLIKDTCEQHGCMSVTNAAEEVIDDLFQRGMLKGCKRVFYEDTMGNIDELVHDGYTFERFAAARSKWREFFDLSV